MNNFFSKSSEFYFYSDKLAENNPTYQIDNWSGVDDYTIVINMSSKENNLLANSYDIAYDITYNSSDNVICQLSKTEGIIYSNTNSDYFVLTITPNARLSTGDKVNVQIETKANSAYKKTLSANFILTVGKENLSYEIVDSKNSQYLEVNITNTLSYYTIKEQFSNYTVGDKININTYLNLSEEEKQKCYSAIVTLQFNPKDVVLDMTNSNYLFATSVNQTNVNSYNYINSITFNIEALSSTKVRFYKIDETKDYTYPIVNNESIIKVTSI